MASAPSRYGPRRPGPIGVPSSATTGIFLPSSWTYPLMFWSLGPWWATYFAHSVAPGKQAKTSSARPVADTMAARFRRSLRQASDQPPRCSMCYFVRYIEGNSSK